jgi:hypothetical protein
LFFNILRRVLPNNHEPSRPSPKLLTISKRFLSFSPKFLADLTLYKKLTYVSKKPSNDIKSPLKSTKTLSLEKNTSPSSLNTVGFIFGFMDDNSVSKHRTG